MIFLIVVSCATASSQRDYLTLRLFDTQAVSLRIFTFSAEPYYSMVHEVCFTEDEKLLGELCEELDRQYPAELPAEEPLCWGEIALADGRIVSLEIYEDTVVLEHGLAVMRCSLPARVYRQHVPSADAPEQ